MSEQNFSNHRRFHPVYHFILYPVLLILLIGSCINLNDAVKADAGVYSASLIVLISIVLIVMALLARGFALKAQDRAIRAEENLRYFAITGKLMDNELTMPQIIALRFASNNELMDLAHQAVSKKLSNTEIKKAIKHWRADHSRL